MRTLGLTLLAGVLLGGAGTAGEGPPPFGVRGTIEKVTPAPPRAEKGLLGHVMVAGKKQPDTETDRAVAIVTRKTRVVKGAKTPARWEDLKKGVRVEVKFRPGPRILIYPTRAEAELVRILR